MWGVGCVFMLRVLVVGGVLDVLWVETKVKFSETFQIGYRSFLKRK